MTKYPDFKSYMQANYIQEIKEAIESFVETNHDGSGFHSLNVLSLCRQKVEKPEIIYMSCHEVIGDRISMDLSVAADIVTKGLGTTDYDADRKKKWFLVHMHAELINGIHDVGVEYVEEYYNKKYDKEGALDEFLIPYISTDDLEDEADLFFEIYCESAFPLSADMYRLPYSHIMREMRIQAYEAPLPDNVFGRMYFRPAQAKYYHQYYPTVPKKMLFDEEVPRGTMLINENHFFMGSIGSTLNTIAHELVHWDKHQKFFEIMYLLDSDRDEMSCEVAPALNSANLTGLQKAIWWAEWQANTLAPRILMPRRLFTEVFEDTYAEVLEYDFHDRGQAMEDTLEKVAELFGVSKFEAKTRAIQLGYDDADAAMLYVNGEYFFPLSFKRGSLKKNETFILDRDSFEKICATNTDFAALIESGLFVYADCVVCINDPQFVRKETGDYRKSEYTLTEDAKYSLEKCCLKFMRRFRRDSDFDIEFYGQCYLSKELEAAAYCETDTIDDEDTQDTKARAIELAKLNDEFDNMDKVFEELPSTFRGTLDYHIRRKKMVNPRNGKLTKLTNLEIANRTGLSEDHIASLRKEKEAERNVKLDTVCALCIALHLHPAYSEDLIEKANFKLSRDKEGLAARLILNQHYMDTLELCNKTLIEMGCRPWGKIPAA